MTNAICDDQPGVRHPIRPAATNQACDNPGLRQDSLRSSCLGLGFVVFVPSALVVW